jgi:hypothetical protein
MPSLLFSIFLLLQNVNVKEITGRVSVEPGVQFPSSFTLPLTTATTTSLTIRPQIDGTFRLQLPPGEYRVGTPGRLPPGYSLQSIAYGGVDLLRSPLKIASNDSTELVISLALTGPSPAVSVSGRVTGIAPGDVHRISLREPTGRDLSAALETSVAADGSFTFPKVLPGNYIVYQRLLVQTPITVGNTNVTGLIVARPKDILVAAHVIAEGAQTTPTILLESRGSAGATQSRGSGSIVLNMGIGENSISVSGIPDGFRLKSITYGDVDLQKQPLKLDGPAVWDIIVRLAPKN